ncbi:MAG: hypothetical protein CBC38_06385 [Gammaproteobacteria bacterium TMED78]|nr:MAG: hypothetical protein CBC38_06385 [Gammaproteobacteria bacterium TMED78]|tara:strand:- start:51444 stop:51872 length:429 start_codon:yes stop_codon:yes gene_type:complete
MKGSINILQAGFFKRILANIYDSIIILALIMVLTLAIIIFRDGKEIVHSSTWFTLFIFASHFSFFIWFWTHGGQTLGMRAWGIRVVSSKRESIGLICCIRRYILSFSIIFPPGFCFIWSFFDEERLFFNDRFSETRIININK